MSDRIIKDHSLRTAEFETPAPTVSRRIIPRHKVRLENMDIVTSENPPAVLMNEQPAPGSDADPKLPKAPLTPQQMLNEKIRELEQQHQAETEAAYRNGFQAGKAEGVGEGAAYADKVKEFFEKLIMELTKQQESRIKEIEASIARLSLNIAEAIIGEAALKASRDSLEYNIDRCLGVLKGSGKVKIRINPIDYDFARDNAQILQNVSRGKFIFEYEPDPSIAPGGCFFESSGGTVDGRLDSQFELLRNDFMQLTAHVTSN